MADQSSPLGQPKVHDVYLKKGVDRSHSSGGPSQNTTQPSIRSSRSPNPPDSTTYPANSTTSPETPSENSKMDVPTTAVDLRDPLVRAVGAHSNWEVLYYFIAILAGLAGTYTTLMGLVSLLMIFFALFGHCYRVWATENALLGDLSAGILTLIMLPIVMVLIVAVAYNTMQLWIIGSPLKNTILLRFGSIIPSILAGFALILRFRFLALRTMRPPMPSSPVGSRMYEAERRKWVHKMRSIHKQPSVIHPINLMFTMIVAGSGGHTAEMIDMLRESPTFGPNGHRRWVVTRGDDNSVAEIKKFENAMKFDHRHRPRLGAGTYDIYFVRRVRKVHQSLLTVPYSLALCVADVFNVLTAGCPAAASVKGYPYPHSILTNGPGTGFVVALTSFVMRLIMIIPDDLCKIVFIESFARVKTLSMTGKIFYWTGIADRFIAQHEPVAKRYGVHCEFMLAAREC